MVRYRLTQAAQDDIVEILDWTEGQFGEHARHRYAALLVAALRDVGARSGDGTARPELGEGVFTWHLRLSRDHSSAGVVRRPRHFLVYRLEHDVVVVGRVLHDSMELRRHVDPGGSWE